MEYFSAGLWPASDLSVHEPEKWQSGPHTCVLKCFIWQGTESNILQGEYYYESASACLNIDFKVLLECTPI
jgi:hypothetical protein